MEKTKTDWYARFPDYYTNAKEYINKIRKRKEKNVFLPFPEDEFLTKRLQLTNISKRYHCTGKILLRDILTRFQYFAHFNDSPTEIKPKCYISMSILGRHTEFELEESRIQTKRGWQILIMEQGIMPKYAQIMTSLKTINSVKLAMSILKALETSLDCQTTNELTGCTDQQIKNVASFILLTHVAEAAVPSCESLEEYLKILKENSMKGLETEKCGVLFNKQGRIPMMDKLVRAKLRKVVQGENFNEIFSLSKFPIQETGGTAKARAMVLRGLERDDLTDIEDDLQSGFGEIRLS